MTRMSQEALKARSTPHEEPPATTVRCTLVMNPVGARPNSIAFGEFSCIHALVTARTPTPWLAMTSASLAELSVATAGV